MISDEDFELDFAEFYEKAEISALEARCAFLLSRAALYDDAGLPEAALKLYEDLDTPENIARIAGFNEHNPQIIRNFDILINPQGHRIKDSLVDRLIKQVTENNDMPKSSELEQHLDDTFWTSGAEVEIASNKAHLYLCLDKADKAVMQADRLKNHTYNPVAQYAAALVYASQGMRDRAVASLEILAELGYNGSFPNYAYFKSVWNEEVFRDLQTAKIILHGASDTMLYAHQDDTQRAILIERAAKEAEETYKLHILGLLSDYIEFNVDSGYVRDAEAAANKAQFIDGANGGTSELFAYIYNRSDRHDEAFRVLSHMENSLSSYGLLELALSLTMRGEDAEAYKRLERSLTLEPSLYEELQDESFAPLRLLESQPGYHLLMAKSNAIANSNLHPN